jgi:hypothetical protein
MRFLLRGSALLISLLILWWCALLGPMLYLLRSAAGGFVLIADDPSGDWTLRVSIEKILPATPLRPVAQRIQSIDFDMPRGDALTFTFSLPVYWAIILAAPRVKRNLCPLLLGTAIMSAVEVALLVAFAYITAYNAVSQLGGPGEADGRWIRHLGEYMVVNVLPYIVPFAVALSLNRELRGKVFPFSKEPKVPAPARLRGSPQRRRSKNQGS